MKFPTVKVCGNTDPKIIKLCIELGASLIGFIINYPKSPRSISVDKLKKLTTNQHEKSFNGLGLSRPKDFCPGTK